MFFIFKRDGKGIKESLIKGNFRISPYDEEYELGYDELVLDGVSVFVYRTISLSWKSGFNFSQFVMRVIE